MHMRGEEMGKEKQVEKRSYNFEIRAEQDE